MLIPEPLKKGNKVAIISLSSGILGEPYSVHTKNVNFGHAMPRAILPYGAKAIVDAKKQEIVLL